jgi:hypothetical protein
MTDPPKGARYPPKDARCPSNRSALRVVLVSRGGNATFE